MSRSRKPGDVVAERFTLTRPMSEATWSAFERAPATNTDAQVAVSFGADETSVRLRFARLTRAHELARGVCPAPIDVGQDQGEWFLAREWLEGRTLEDELAHGALVAARFHTAMQQTLEAVSKLHRAWLAHGALEPSVIVTDATRARLLAMDGPELAPGASDPVLRSLAYLAPEQVDATALVRATAASDLWALGLIAFELATGHGYWSADSPASLLASVRSGAIEPPSVRCRSLQIATRLPSGFDDWFLACVSRDAGRRYVDATEALDAFEVMVVRRAAGGGAVENAAVPNVCLMVMPAPCLKVAPMPFPCLRPQVCLSMPPKLPPAVDHERVEYDTSVEGGPYRGVMVRRSLTDEARARRARRAGLATAVVLVLGVGLALARRC
jgi:serine/threonine protein kinase